MGLLRLYIARTINFIVALQILNLSFFAQDFRPLRQSQTSLNDYNIINTVVEYVAETVLQHHNAIAENNKEHKDLQAHKHVNIQMIIGEKRVVFGIADIAFSQSRLLFRENYYYQYFNEINPPPPKAMTWL